MLVLFSSEYLRYFVTYSGIYYSPNLIDFQDDESYYFTANDHSRATACLY